MRHYTHVQYMCDQTHILMLVRILYCRHMNIVAVT